MAITLVIYKKKKKKKKKKIDLLKNKICLLLALNNMLLTSWCNYLQSFSLIGCRLWEDKTEKKMQKFSET